MDKVLLLFLAFASVATNAAWAASVSTLSQGIRHDSLFDLCVGEDRSIAVGDAGVVLESDDGGASWQRMESFTQSALLGVSCDAGSQFIVGQEGIIFRRDNDQFHQLDSGSDQRLLAIASDSEGLVFAVGGFGAVLRSADNGDTWEPLSFDWETILDDFVEPHIYEVDIAEDGTIVLTGEFSLILRSTDRGDTWEVVNRGDESLFGMHLDDQQGFAVGQNGLVLATSNGGATWSKIEVPSGANLLDVRSFGDGNVLITGIREMLSSNDYGKSWRRLDIGDFSVGWYQSIGALQKSATSGNTAILVGHSGRIVKLEI